MPEGIITFNDWNKLNLQVAEILETEDIKGADKLLKLKIDLGTETRILIAGIKQNYTKEELNGKRIVVLTNLEPKTMRGIESQGMLLAAVSDDHSEVKLLQPDGAMALGSRVS